MGQSIIMHGIKNSINMDKTLVTKNNNKIDGIFNVIETCGLQSQLIGKKRLDEHDEDPNFTQYFEKKKKGQIITLDVYFSQITHLYACNINRYKKTLSPYLTLVYVNLNMSKIHA